MDKVKELIRSKPRIFVYITGVYLLVMVLIKWLTNPSLDALWFFVGGAIGIYFLDAAEIFFGLQPSPFRSIVFGTLFAVVAFFVVTSSASMVGIGLVLSLYLQMLLWQVGEWRVNKNLDSWYRMVAGPVSISTQRSILIIAFIIFLVETIIFVR
jgi:hypothetical protein